MVATAGMTAFTVYVLGSLFYVYKLRGQTRYENLTEYLRKGWPLFAPLNCLLYLFTPKAASAPILDTNDYPELKYLRDNWQTIRDEALELYRKQHFDSIKKPGAQSYYDIGFRTFYKYGWSKFYLKWYGYTHASALSLCPKTVEILKQVPSVNGAMFSLLPPGSQLTRHLDPVACSLRYHLGLSTPNNDSCFINIDGNTHSWRDGKDLLFDETYLHFAKNNSDSPRLILMCDFERPTNIFGKFFNFLYKGLARLTVVPNMEGDKRGLANRVFSGLAPVLQKTKALKETHPTRYKFIKYSVNGLLTALVFLIFYILLRAIQLFI